MLFFTAQPSGQIGYIVGPPPGGSPFNNGVAFAPDGRVYVTATSSATDQWIGGNRVTALGEIVYAAQAAAIVSNAGLPANQTGGSALASQFDVAGGATDNFASGGYRVGPLGGVYLINALPFP